MPTESDVHRLKDIVVEEVSLVDRAANKRRFLVVKKDSPMSALKSNGRGGFTRMSKGDDEDEAEKAKKAAEAAADDDEAAEKAFPPAADDKGGEGDDEATEKAKGKAPAFPGAAKPFGGPPGKDKETDDAEKATKADASGKALAAELRGAMGDLGSLVDELDEHEEGEPTEMHMKKCMDVHKKLSKTLEKFAKSTAKVDKAGRKMAGHRLEMFAKALDTLQSLLSELMETPAKEKEHEADPGDPQMAPKGWSPANPSGVSKALEDKIDSMLSATKALVSENQVLKKRVHKLESGAGGAMSNALPAGSVRKSASSSDHLWPLDMAESVSKGDDTF